MHTTSFINYYMTNSRNLTGHIEYIDGLCRKKTERGLSQIFVINFRIGTDAIYDAL